VSNESESLIHDYLKELKRELRGLPRHRRRRFLKEVQTRVAAARSSLSAESEAEIRRMLDRLGHPADVAAEAHDFARRPVRRSALEDGALTLLSPLVILVAVFVAPVLLLGWVVGAIMLWLSRAWTAGEKLMGMTLSGVSFVWAGIIGFNLQISDPEAGFAGVVLAVSLIGFFLLVQMVPALVGVIYLWRTLRRRSAHPAARGVAGVAAASAG
jgi:uncharacterized membrane protein